jgi:hypothetical protein
LRQSTLSLGEPKDGLLGKMYEAQGRRIQAIAQEIMEIEELREVCCTSLVSFMINARELYSDKHDVCCGCPVKMTFKGDSVVSSICVTVPADRDIKKTMVGLSVGTLVKIKCRFGFNGKVSSLSLEAEKVDEISKVKLVVD